MRLCVPLILLGWSFAGQGAEVTVAVASNFLTTLQLLEVEFERSTGHELVFSAGSTGQLYAQIVNGAPFDVFLAADDARPARLADSGLGVPSSRFTYALGQLALWSREPGKVDAGTLDRLANAEFRFFAIAGPEVAPYGAAAMQVLVNLGIADGLAARIVTGQNVSQAFTWIATGTADLGLVALSQALNYGGASSFAAVPSSLHEPIRQDAVLLERAAGNPAATDFLAFLKGPAAKALIERNGYLVPP